MRPEEARCAGTARSGRRRGPAARRSQTPPAGTSDAALIAEAKQFVEATDKELRRLLTDASVADWANQTDITPAARGGVGEGGRRAGEGHHARLIKAARKFEPVMAKLDPATRRQLSLLKFSGQPAPDDPKQADELAKVGTRDVVGLRQGQGRA